MSGHLEDGQLRCGPETVLDTAKYAVRAAILPLELQYHIDDMLEDLGTGDETVLGDMSDQYDRDAGLLGKAKQLGRNFLDLRYRTGSRIQSLREHRLHRIDDHQLGHHGTGLCKDILHQRLAENETLPGIASQPFGPHLDLIDTLFTGNVKGTEVGAMQRDLERERGLAYARLAAYQHERARDYASAEETVHLAVVQGDARLAGGGDVAQLHGAVALPCRDRGAGNGLTALFRLLHHGIPFAAGGAAPHPFWAFVSARSAVPDGLDLVRHISSPQQVK